MNYFDAFFTFLSHTEAAIHSNFSPFNPLKKFSQKPPLIFQRLRQNALYLLARSLT